MNDLNNSIYIEKKVRIQVTPQARKVLSFTKYTEEDLINDYIENNGFSIGGHNVVVFLEKQNK